MKRRYFLGAAALAGACSRPQAAAGFRILTVDQVRTLNAWLDCLIPEDDAPGAVQTGVVQYIDRQLTRRFRKQRPDYERAIQLVDERALAQHGRLFADLDFDKRTAILEEFENSERGLFEMVLNHCLQGFYGSPRHGGNKDYASWRMLGVPPAPIRGRQHYVATGEQA